MQQRNRSGLVELGIGLLVLGLVVKIAISIGWMLNGLATWAMIIGGVVLVLGLISPGRR